MRTPTGATRVHLIVGDPVAQTKSPAGLTAEFASRGVDAICVPAHVRPADFDAFMRVAKATLNIDGIVITVPHKFAALAHCDALEPRSRLLGAVNAMRREGNGRWRGDMTDGVALVAALRAAHFEPAGKRALVVGAGGAGSAVALALADSAVAALAIREVDAARRDDLLARLRKAGVAHAHEDAAADVSGYDLVVNATPVGMAAGDPLPIDAGGFRAGMMAADLITKPAVTPFLAAAREKGARMLTGEAMFAPQTGILGDFLLRR